MPGNVALIANILDYYDSMSGLGFRCLVRCVSLKSLVIGMSQVFCSLIILKYFHFRILIQLFSVRVLHLKFIYVS